jgi:hypothetical protein
VLKIHKQQFLEHLGGMLGEPTCVLQGNEKTMLNWFKMKLEKMSKMNVKTFFQLSYQDQQYYDSL